MKRQMIMIVLAMSLALINEPVYAEEIDTSFVNGYEEDEREPLEIFGANDIYVDKGDKIDILKGVSANREVTFTVSGYDENLYNKDQIVTITAVDEFGDDTYAQIILRIRSFKVKPVKKTLFATITTNVRAKPTSKSKKLGVVKFNQRLEVTGKVYGNGLDQKDSSNKWYRIKYKGKTAYITTKYSYNKRIKKDGTGWRTVLIHKENIETGWFDRDGNHLESEVWNKAVEEAAKKEK